MDFDRNKIKLKIAISKIKEENDIVMESKKRNYLKVFATTMASVILCSSVVFAGVKVYENINIWKEPKGYTYDEMISALPPQEVTEEEKQKIITEDKAKEVAIEYLNKLGYENQTINRVELKRGYTDDVTSYYMVKTKYGYEEGLMVQINANSGAFISFDDMDLKYKHLKTQVLSNEEISRIATDIYNKLGIKENTYKLTETQVENYYFQNKHSDMLIASFDKYYDGISNKYETVKISFIVSNGEVFLNTVMINEDSSYQDNEVVITKEQAIQVATDKEKEFSNYDITNIESELTIEKMNAFIYRIENQKDESTTEQTYYKTDNITRKVWKVKIEHGLTYSKSFDDINKYMKEGSSKYYFIDATTGEIIGGDSVKYYNK